MLDRQARTIEFTQLSGDFHRFHGRWRVDEATGGGTLVVFDATFDLGMASLEAILDPIAETTLRNNLVQILQGLLGDVREEAPARFPGRLPMTVVEFPDEAGPGLSACLDLYRRLAAGVTVVTALGDDGPDRDDCLVRHLGVAAAAAAAGLACRAVPDAGRDPGPALVRGVLASRRPA